MSKKYINFYLWDWKEENDDMDVTRVVVPILATYKKKKMEFKFKLNLFIRNKQKFIVFWYPYFENLQIDLCQTPKWKNKTLNKMRKSLFEYLNKNASEQKFKQKERKNLKDKEIVTLTKEELKIANQWFFENSDKSTFNNISGIITGRNPGGKISNPNAAEMRIDSDDINPLIKCFISNIVDLLIEKNIKLKKKKKEKLKSQEISNSSFIEFMLSGENNNSIYHEIFNAFLTEAKMERKEITQKIMIKYQNWLKKSSYFTSFCLNVRKKVKKLRNKNQKYKPNVFHKEWDKILFERAHIYPVQKTQKELEDNLNDFYNSYFISNKAINLSNSVFKQKINSFEENAYRRLDEIANKNNLLDMDKNTHALFDSNVFSYNEKGEIQIKVNRRAKDIDEIYNKIPKEKLNKEMIFFIDKRNRYYVDNEKYKNYTNEKRIT
ncbi:MAG4270 family putative restriction endonuclease [Mycoplasmopsis glycophila]|uniref:Uncharacterized protein n=1 Tax=Mycoplasmopsis glycophila TaxID=171285 RepID=A0A449AVT9_9BACT|nr:hypothetical protein [Mycoplasmopsis glycophila]VEU70719.1 Uncharacterised protein [Mycoplasmopsis glycophila]